LNPLPFSFPARFSPGRRRALAGVAALGAGALAGCATQTAALLEAPGADLPRRVELADTPFFPQDQRFLVERTPFRRDGNAPAACEDVALSFGSQSGS